MADRSRIESKQLKKLQGLIGELLKGNDFYRSRLRSAGVDSKIGSLAEFSRLMPFTSKMDLVWDREEFAPYGSNLTYPQSDYSRFCQSSGTTRGPLPSLDTTESWSAMLDCWDRVYEAAQVETSEVVFFAFSFGPFLGFWTAFESATRRGNLSIPGGGLSSKARLQAMVAHDAGVLCCTPTYALRLGEHFATHENDEMSSYRLKKIIVAGEPGGSIPAVRERLSELWKGASIFDHHGMTEVGPVTYEHPDKPLSLCVIEDAYYVEVIDRETHQEVAPGEQGELVITTLTRKACPLLRYRTGDLVEKAFLEDSSGGEPSFCLEGGILGRVDEMVVIRGVNIYPTAVEKIIRGFPEVIEFQVVQTMRQSMAELEVTLEARDAASKTGDLAERVARELADAFTLRIPVRLVEPGSLPRYEFKSKRWLKQ
ncbi:AMP-binding protein [Verrucomicrobiales bacterium]|nr:AMP-binding protein [Verrucomicrobiales bacterium]|tara:strand:- start:1533 stop:2810 length:1278 start_codon:yes stop_codon:yes gene_type:complete